MTKEEIYSFLCDYDLRNPDGVISYYTEEDIKEAGCTNETKKGCSCDNCFTGKTPLANYIIDNLFKTHE